jgi:hypothetical protein
MSLFCNSIWAVCILAGDFGIVAGDLVDSAVQKWRLAAIRVS